MDNNYTAFTRYLSVTFASSNFLPHISGRSRPQAKGEGGGGFVLLALPPFPPFLIFCHKFAYDLFSNLLQDGLTEIFQSLIENLKSCLITCKPIYSVHVVSFTYHFCKCTFHFLVFFIQGKSNGTEENYGQACSLNKDYSCDACQKDFTSKETLNAHLGSHVQVWRH